MFNTQSSHRKCRRTPANMKKRRRYCRIQNKRKRKQAKLEIGNAAQGLE